MGGRPGEGHHSLELVRTCHPKNMNPANKPDLRVDPLVFGCLAAAKVLLHLGFNPRYGLHRDEYLYLAEARHLDWGFLEVPPFTPFVGRIALWLGGDISVVRFFPALAGVVTLWAILAMVRTFGGGRRASWLAGLAFLFSVSFLGSNVLYQPVSFTQMWWALISLFAAWALYYQKPKYWIFFGIGIGLAWLTKYTIAVFGFSIFLGLMLTPQRKVLGKRPFWLSIGLAALIAMPNVFWQFAHDLPVLRHMSELRSTQLVNVGWFDFLSYQLIVHGVGMIVWIPGLVWLLRAPAGKTFRFLGLAWCFVILFFLFLQGKGYYTMGTYPALMAAGGVALAGWTEKRKPAWTYGLVGLLLIGNLPIIPFGFPVLSLKGIAAYGQWMKNELGFGMPLRWEDGRYHDLPQDFADMQGWEEMAEKAITLYESLPEERKARCVIWGGGYGHAGALLYYGRERGLPDPVCLNSSFALWAPDSLRMREMIQLDDRRYDSSPHFGRVILVDSVENEYARDPGYLYHLMDPVADIQEVYDREKAEVQYWKGD